MVRKPWINQEEETEIKNTLINFIKRVSLTDKKWECEVAILPKIVELTLNNEIGRD